MPHTYHTEWKGTVLLLGVLCVGILLALREQALQPDGNLHLHVLNVGQGDSLLIVSPSGKRVLIDGGPDLLALEELGRLLPFFDRSIELVIATHPEADHIGALPKLLDHYDVRSVLLTGIAHPSRRYEAFLRKLAEGDIPLFLPDPSMDLDLGGGLTLDILWPKTGTFGSIPKEVNDTSIVLRALYKDTAILLTGDIERKAEAAILKEGTLLTSDVLKVPHHGSRSSSSEEFLLAAHPAHAIISVGKDNPYGHPHEEVTKRYQELGIVLRSTAEEGTISLAFP